MGPGSMGEQAITRRYLAIVGLYSLAIHLPLAVVVLHMADRGLSIGLIGLTFAVRSILVVLFEVPTGGLADAIGRKPVALLAQGLTLLSIVVLWLVTGPTLALVYAVLQGIGAALSSGSLDAWYVDALQRADPEVDLQRNLAKVSIADGAGLLIGTSLGGALPALASGLALPWALTGFGLTLFASVAFRLLAWGLTATLVHEPPRAVRGTVAGLRAVPAIVRDAGRLSRSLPVVRYLLVGMMVSGVAVGAVETFWQPIADVILPPSAAAEGTYGLLGALIGVAVLLGGAAVLRFGDRMPGGSAMLAFAGQLLKGGGLIVLAIQVSALGLAGGLALAYFAISAAAAPHDAILNRAVPSERRSVMLSVNSLAWFVGLAVGNGLLGWVAQANGPRLALILAGVLTTISALSYLGAGRVLTREGDHTGSDTQPDGPSPTPPD